MEVSGQLQAPDRFTPGERAFGTYRIGGWVSLVTFMHLVLLHLFHDLSNNSQQIHSLSFR